MKTIHSKVYKSLIEDLKQKRLEMKLTQASVSRALGKTQSYISKIENYEKRLDILEFVNLSKVYRIQPSEVLKSHGW